MLIKFCGLRSKEDIMAVNSLKPDYAGFVFASFSKRYVTEEEASVLKSYLSDDITAVGVFVDEIPKVIASMIERGIIDMAQLHGSEDDDHIRCLRGLTDAPIIKAFRISKTSDLDAAYKSTADHILLDSGMGSGNTLSWNDLKGFDRPYFLAGGLTPDNASEAIKELAPYALDVSSGIETDGRKDPEKMRRFIQEVRR